MSSLLLASQSPRRKELLTETGFSFTAVASGASEDIDSSYSPSETVEELALRKASSVLTAHPGTIVLGADTVVAFNGKILGKPASEDEARSMLTQLFSASHHVYTGVAILSDQRTQVFHDVTEVTFHPIDNKLLQSYLSSAEPYDKAGAYGIQGKGRLFVKSIRGDYFNVVGLPISRTAQNLQEFGVYPSI